MIQRLSLKYVPRMAVLTVIISFTVFAGLQANAAQLLDRSVRLLDPKPSVQTSYTFAFNIQSNSSVGSIAFEYCTNDPFFDTVCDAPAGLDVSGATLSSEAGETGFSVDPTTTTNRLVLGRPPVIASIGQTQYVFGNIINPSTIDQPVYVRIGLHSSSDGSGSRADQGSVVFVIVDALDTRAYVPPHLTFCTGVTVNTDCSDAAGFSINLGELSSEAASAATSQYAGATNDLTGYSVAIFGVTMTSGNDIIPPLDTPTSSVPGTSQFGINLRNNSTPDVGQEPAGLGTATLNPDYAALNNFMFESGDNLSNVALPSDFDRFTISYLVNVSSNQPPGIYNATFTFVATALF